MHSSPLIPLHERIALTGDGIQAADAVQPHAHRRGGVHEVAEVQRTEGEQGGEEGLWAEVGGGREDVVPW